MVISLLCTGYASWIITDPVSSRGGINNDTTVFTTYGVSHHTLADFGIAFSAAQGETFRYSTTSSIGSDGSSQDKYKFTNTTVSVHFTIEDETMDEQMLLPDYREESVRITCQSLKKEIAGLGSRHYSITTLGSYGVKLPDFARLTVEGYPNLSITPPIVNDTNAGTLTMTIPVEQIYNLAKLDKLTDGTTTLILELVFEDNVTSNNNGMIKELSTWVNPVFTVALIPTPSQITN